MATDDRIGAMADAVARLKRKHGTARWEMSFEALLIIISQLQLALRHPLNRGESGRKARQMIDGLIDKLARDEPILAQLMRLGFDPRADVDIGGAIDRRRPQK